MSSQQGNTQAAYDYIRQGIIEGHYGSGQRLVEQRIAEEFSLSRTPVREALRRLEAEGLVHTEPNRGSVVRTLTLDDVADLYGLRARLESYAAELAAERIEEDELARLDEAIEAFGDALTIEGEPIEITRAIDGANRLFHDTVLAAARHDRLRRMLDRTVDVPLVFQSLRQFDRAQIERSYMFHMLLRDAIRDGDRQRASMLMYEHILQGRDVLLKAVKAGEASADVAPDAESQA